MNFINGITKKAAGLPRHCFLQLRLAHLSLACVGLICVLPFLYYRHAFPLTTFYQEWGAAILGLIAASVLVTKGYWQQPEIPRVVMLPIGMMLLVLIQFPLGKIAYFEQALLLILYMLWAGLMVMVGQRLRAEFELPLLATTIAAFLLLGAELNAFIGMAQHFSWHTLFDGWIAAKRASGVFGNLGQPNHFSDYISLGLVSLGLLHIRKKLRIWQAVLLALPLLFVLVQAGSRSSWLYLASISILAYWLQRHDKSSRPVLLYSLSLWIGFGLMHFAVQLPWMTGTSAGVTSFERLTEQVSGGSLRLYMWHEAWQIFTQFPFLGSGFGQFAWQHFQLGPTLHDPSVQGLFNNAHNLVMHIAAEMGLAGVLVLLVTLGLWLQQTSLFNPGKEASEENPIEAERYDIYHWWGYSALAILGIHSLLEYPLWYAYFLGIAALLLGVFDRTRFHLELRGIGRLSVATMLLLGVLSLLQLWQGYRKLEGLQYVRPTSAGDTTYMQHIRAGLLEGYEQTLLTPYVEFMTASMMEVGTNNLQDKLEVNAKVMHFLPSSSVVYRQVVLLAISGDEAAARDLLERAIWAYPNDFPQTRNRLRVLADRDPARHAALLKFAIEKYEEYQLAVRTR